MMPYILLLIGALGLAATIGYGSWVELRVWILRQDLFEIRDRLWDDAWKGGFLDDPSYRACRESLNAIIRLAPRLSFPVWAWVATRVKSGPVRTSSIPQVEAAQQAMAKRLYRYIFRQTLTGVLFAVAAPLIRRASGRALDRNEAQRIVKSDRLTRLDHQYEKTMCAAHLQI